MRDRLNLFEKLNYLDVDNWLTWREVHNRLAHEYPDQPEIRFADLMAAIDAAKAFAERYSNWRARFKTSPKPTTVANSTSNPIHGLLPPMPIIEVNHVTKEYQLGQLQSLKTTALNQWRQLTGQQAEERAPFKALDDVTF